MKKISLNKLLLLCFIILCIESAHAENPRKDDFENITSLFQIRNLQNGIAINLQRSGDLNTQNWILRQFDLNAHLITHDKLRDRWSFGYVQFVRPDNLLMCLAIGEDGFLTTKSCLQDLQSEKLETVFSLIPVGNGAVQIRSLVLNSDECLSAFENPNIPIEKRFGITPCTLDFFLIIDPSELFFFTPALTKARPLQ